MEALQQIPGNNVFATFYNRHRQTPNAETQRMLIGAKQHYDLITEIIQPGEAYNEALVCLTQCGMWVEGSIASPAVTGRTETATRGAGGSTTGNR